MKNSRIFGYGLGSLGKDLALGVIGSYLLLFYTDVLDISAASAGFILVVTKIWDAINDPMMGAIVDRTNSKYGRFRPYILFVPVPLAIFSVLCFVAPNISTTGKFIYALVTYTITGMLFTAYDVPLWGMVPSIADNENDRNKCISVARFFTSFAMLLATSIAFPLIEKLGGGSEKENLMVGFPKFMIIIGIISVIFAWITFASTKEKEINNVNEKRENVFKEFISIVNKPLIIVFVSMILQAVTLVLPSVIGAYYMINYIHRPDLIPVYFMVSGIIALFAPGSAAILLKKLSAKKLTVLSMTCSAIVSLVAFIIPSTNIKLLFVIFGIFGFFNAIPMVSITTMLVETAEYIGESTGKRADGVIFSLNSFAIKCGTALASGIASLILAITKYNPSSFEQLETVGIGLNIGRTLLVSCVYIIAIIIVSQFSIPKVNSNSKVEI